MSRILSLSALEGVQAGGKANGLYRLIRLGLSVPDGFVLLDVDPLNLPEELPLAYDALGCGLVAVRSSALDEDGEDASFAGQYETILNVEGLPALEAAIHACLASLESQRATAYRGDQAGSVRMCVVVQRMVNACAAGVLFTADPVTARRDILVIDAVQGLGEALVSGEVTPDHYEFDLDNRRVQQALAGEHPILNDATCLDLIKTAREAARSFGEPLDLEWATDSDGRIYWLQARPITTLPADLCEFDESVCDTDVFTTGNIAEMMPGAVCPMSLSVTLRGIEYGFQHLDILLGAQPDFVGHFTQVNSFYGRWFFNLTGKVAGGGYIAGMSAREAGFSICGQDVPELKDPPRQPLWIRLRGGWRFFRWLQSAEAGVDQFAQRLAQEFQWQALSEPAAMMQQIEGLVWWVFAAEDVHVCSSASSAVASGILQGVITKGELPTSAQLGLLASWSAGAEGVESAELVKELDAVAGAIRRDVFAEAFVSSDAAAAHDWLETRAPDGVREAWKGFLQRHGHRAYRELCVREKGWSEDPLALISTVQTNVRGLLQSDGTQVLRQTAGAHSPPGGLARWWLRKVHAGIRRRERSKSQLVRVTREIGKAYRHLGRVLVAQQLLPDEDLIYFFTHEELCACLGVPSIAQVRHAQRRRQAMAYQNRLQMPFLVQGKPGPLQRVQASSGNVLIGRPVSQGTVEGICRVAHSPAEAAAVQSGEILIAPVTDVAWTPYFSVIAGLATDIGSSVSHGAVIAREYGLPAVVNLGDATRRCQTGMRVRLDGSDGTLTLLDQVSE